MYLYIYIYNLLFQEKTVETLIENLDLVANEIYTSSKANENLKTDLKKLMKTMDEGLKNFIDETRNQIGILFQNKNIKEEVSLIYIVLLINCN